MRLAVGLACRGIPSANICALDGVEPKFKVPERPSKLDAFADRLSAWLRTEAKKNRKQKRTMKQLHADLLSLGYEGSYGRVAAFAREWKADLQRELQTTGRGTFVPLAFEPGEAFQFDWSEDWAIIGNERTKLQVAHTKLSYSRAFIVRAYLLRPLRTRGLPLVAADLGLLHRCAVARQHFDQVRGLGARNSWTDDEFQSFRKEGDG